MCSSVLIAELVAFDIHAHYNFFHLLIHQVVVEDKGQNYPRLLMS